MKGLVLPRVSCPIILRAALTAVYWLVVREEDGETTQKALEMPPLRQGAASPERTERANSAAQG